MDIPGAGSSRLGVLGQSHEGRTRRSECNHVGVRIRRADSLIPGRARRHRHVRGLGERGGAIRVEDRYRERLVIAQLAVAHGNYRRGSTGIRKAGRQEHVAGRGPGPGVVVVTVTYVGPDTLLNESGFPSGSVATRV